MDVIATTPFGRRPMTLGMLATQIDAGEIDPDKRVDKWKLFRALCEARAVLGVGDRALAVLNALLSFYPDTTLCHEAGLVVFPSNAQLSIRAHGMAPATLRRHLAELVRSGLIIRRDSPNGKRYARKGAEGAIEQAFGFNLAPLVARADEIEAAAARTRAETERLRLMRERISLCRRDISKLIQTGMDEGVDGDWQGLFLQFRAIITAIPRNAMTTELDHATTSLEALRQDILKRLESFVISTKSSASESQTERLIQNSNTNSYVESEPSFETKQDAPQVDDQTERRMRPGREIETDSGGAGRSPEPAATKPGAAAGAVRPFPLGLVLQACPGIADYGPAGAVANWRDLMSAAVVVRSMLGVSPSAYQEACEAMGPENAATVIACILERAGHINSAGGYLRDLTRRAERGEFGIGPMLMALAKANAPAARKVG
ncbi:MAG: replication initiation protein RepC [Rhizobium sp.]|nr:replication initiation protein RepC [Rhizobium sp.]